MTISSFVTTQLTKKHKKARKKQKLAEKCLYANRGYGIIGNCGEGLSGENQKERSGSVSSEIDVRFNALIETLRAKEQEEKKRYDAAIDIEDMTEATDVTIDARMKIQQLRKWADDLKNLQKEISVSFVFPEPSAQSVREITSAVSNPASPESVDEDGVSLADSAALSAGEYVRQKLYQLSRTGFIFSEEQLLNIQDYFWCRNTLRLPHPLARIYDDSKDIIEQTAITGKPRRYWVKDRFVFGAVTLLIYSGWAELYLPYFNSWYDSLNVSVSNESGLESDCVVPQIEKVTEPNTISENVQKNDKDFASVDETPTEFSLFGEVYVWDGWSDVLIRLCEKMVLNAPYKILAIGANSSVLVSGHPVLWLDKREDSDESHRLSNGLSIAKNATRDEVLCGCERILHLCGYDFDSLKIS